MPTVAILLECTFREPLLGNRCRSRQVRGRGGDSATNEQAGVSIRANGVVRGGTTAPLTIEGYGGGTATTGENFGVRVHDSGALVTSLGADVNVTGEGGNGSLRNIGIYTLFNGQITAGGLGDVTVVGTGHGTGHGVAAFSAPAGNYTSGGGNVDVTGTATGSGTGVFLQSGGNITAGGTGTVTVTGDSDSGFGLYDAGLVSSGGGDVIVTATSTSGTGIRAGTFNTSVNGGDITVYADSGTFGANAGTDDVTIRQATNGTAITIGTAVGGTLSIGDLTNITGNTITIGDANTGAITVNAVSTSPGNLVLSGDSYTASASLEADGDIDISTRGTVHLSSAPVRIRADNDSSGSGSVTIVADDDGNSAGNITGAELSGIVGASITLSGWQVTPSQLFATVGDIIVTAGNDAGVGRQTRVAGTCHDHSRSARCDAVRRCVQHASRS